MLPGYCCIYYPLYVRLEFQSIAMLPWYTYYFIIVLASILTQSLMYMYLFHAMDLQCLAMFPRCIDVWFGASMLLCTDRTAIMLPELVYVFPMCADFYFIFNKHATLYFS